MKKAVHILAGILLFANALAQKTGSIEGLITDSASNPIPFASIQVKLADEKHVASAVSDLDGYFTVQNLNPGNYNIRVSSIGFNASQISQIKVDSGQKIMVPVTLTYNRLELSCIVVACYSSNTAIQCDQTVKGITWKGNDKKRIQASKLKTQTIKQAGQGKGKPSGIKNPISDDEYAEYEDNRFLSTRLNPLSTFSADVDKASYSLVRKLIRDGQKPPAAAVRIEEMINYFEYDYPEPTGKHPFSVITEYTQTPWNIETNLLKVAIQGKRIQAKELPPSIFTFLIDVSGSMNSSNKLPLVKASLLKLLESLRPQDKVGIVVYAGAAGVVLKPQESLKKGEIIEKIINMNAGGSTAGGEGIQLAYKLAEEHFVKEGNNRIILCTDGDFNVGISNEADLTKLIEKEREKGIFLTVLGFGMGNYKDKKLELLADKGNGNYAYIDDYQEAEKLLGREFAGTMYTIAKDVKIQVEFNPAHVQSYRLIGYENRLLHAEDFTDDKKDAGEIGAGHAVTALYEIRTVDKKNEKNDELKYQKKVPTIEPIFSNELATIKFRYKKPDEKNSILMEDVVKSNITTFDNASEETRFASSVAAFGMFLRESEFLNGYKLSDIIRLAESAVGKDKTELRSDYVSMLKTFQKL